MSIQTKVMSLIWFLRNPDYLPQVFQILRRRLSWKADRHAHSEALSWCKTIEINEFELIKKIIGKTQDQTIEEDNKEYFDYARKKVKESTVEMGGAGAVNFLYQITKYLRPKNILETGVAYGWSSLAFLLATKGMIGFRLFSIDMPYVKMNNEQFVGIVVHPDLRDNWELIRMADRVGIPKLLKEGIQFDLVHYDSDKSYLGRKWAYPKLWNSLRLGGYLISDDIQDNIAFKEFCKSVSREPMIFQNANRYVGVILKD